MSAHFTSFKANVGTEIGNRKWFISRGAVPLAIALVLFVAPVALLFFAAGTAGAPSTRGGTTSSCSDWPWPRS